MFHPPGLIVVTNIVIEQPPTKTIYLLGELFDPTGIGSIINGFATSSRKGGSFHGGWLGGQVSGAFSIFINSSIAIPIGSLFGSLVTDVWDNEGHTVTPDNLTKAVVCSILSYGFSSFGIIASSAIGESLHTSSHVFLQFLLSYESSLLGISNSIINVY